MMNRIPLLGGMAATWMSGLANAGAILVPAYFYPGSSPDYWAGLTAAASQVSITAIVNPSNGPGPARDSNYSAALAAFRGAGGQVIAYVHTSYGSRDLGLVRTDIDRYADFYAVDGYFIDEMTNIDSGLPYYRSVYDYIKALNPGYRVFGNPGIGTLESYLSIADTLVTFEGPAATTASTPYGYDLYGEPAGWTASYPAERFGHLIYGVAGAGDMQDLVELAISRNAGYLYVTDDVLDNPWDTLPTYWDAEVAAVAVAVAVPEPATGTLFGVGLAGLAALLGLRRRTRILSARRDT